ncbi:MAG: ATP-binding protein [Gemmatimonadaceae bacterium]
MIGALPIRARLALWYAGVLALFMVTFALGGYAFVRRGAVSALDETLAEASTAVGEAIALLIAQGHDVDAAVPAVLDQVYFRDLTIAVLDRQRGMLVGTSPADTADVAADSGALAPVVEVPIDSVHVTDAALARALARAGARRGVYVTVEGDRDPVRVFALPRTLGGRPLVIGAAHSLRAQHRFLREVELALAAGVPVLLLLATAGGYLLARKSLQPVAVMTERAARIGAENLHERLPVTHPPDELGRLAVVVNELLGRVATAFEQQKQLIADASHELRTPVAILSSEAELALARERSPDELRAALTAVREEALRLQHVVEDLFLLARANAGERLVAMEELYVDDLAAECVHAMQALAARKSIGLDMAGERDLPCRGDPSLLRRLLLNLLDNAIKYTPAGGAVCVRTARAAAGYTVSVTDTGAGVPPEARDRLFDRFFRATRARRAGADAPGAGLGLAIARWIAEAHAGRLELAATGEGGSTFVLTLPG